MSKQPIPEGRLRQVTRDGAEVVQLQCPECGRWGDIDDDQLHGRVSVDHTDSGIHPEFAPNGCTFHQTRDWATTAKWEDRWGLPTR